MHYATDWIARICLRPPMRWCLVVALWAAAVGWTAGEAAGQQSRPASARRFAPGVETTINPEPNPADTVSTHDLIEIRANPDIQWDPEFFSKSRTLHGMSQDAKFRRDVWTLEFSFKPLRMMYVDVPQESGKMQRKLIWYMVYRVKNTGQALVPVEKDDGTFTTEIGPVGPVRFLPQFVLEAHDLAPTGEPINKSYLDRIIPAAKAQIQQRELPGRELLNSVEMAEREIPVSDGRIDNSVWGLATWEDIDPRIDFFSVYVSGLTNAYRWVDPPGVYQSGDPPGKGRQFERLTLQLNFWRPGDQFSEHETEVRFGAPRGKASLYGVPEGVAYRWVYR
jgi:hypothetical protein